MSVMEGRAQLRLPVDPYRQALQEVQWHLEQAERARARAAEIWQDELDRRELENLFS